MTHTGAGNRPMKYAEQTWALVVGIDEYADPHIPDLHGAAHDALSAVEWLFRIGVPKTQILLHAEPGQDVKPAVDACGIPYSGATFAEITVSIRRLLKLKGQRLFVFLSGHGLFEPAAQRVFLTAEADADLPTNIGLEWFTSVLQGMQFRRCFVIMDGCLNRPYTESKRSTFKGGEIPGLVAPPVRDDVTVVSCYSARQGERALEVDGHGLFMPRLIKALDPDQPSAFALIIDEGTGELQIDIRRAILDEVGPETTLAAAERKHVQNPTCSVRGEGESWPDIPVVEWTPGSTARVRVNVDPTGSIGVLRSFRLWVESTAWIRLIPSAKFPLQLPFTVVLPNGMSLFVHCGLVNGSPYQAPGTQSVVANADRELIIKLDWPIDSGSSIGSVAAAVRTVSADGQTAFEVSDATYDAVDDWILAESGMRGVTIDRHEWGPVLHVDAEDVAELPGLLKGVAGLVDSRTSAEIGVVTINPGPVPDAVTKIRLLIDPSSVIAIASALGGATIVKVNDTLQISAVELVADREFEVPSGPVHVLLTLPWGSSVYTAQAAEGAVTELEISTDVGIAPLLITLLERLPDVDLVDGPRLMPVDDAYTEGWIENPTHPYEPLGSMESVRDQMREFADWRTLGVLQVAGEQFLFTMPPGRSVAWSREPPRIEPLTGRPTAEWLLVIASGRIDGLAPEDAFEGLFHAPTEPVMGLGVAYVCYSQNRDSYLSIVLDYLRLALQDGPADLPILRAALEMRQGLRSDRTRASLLRVQEVGAVPVFRWGIAIGVLVAEYYELAELQQRLLDVERRSLSSSVWTLWRR